MANEFQQAPQQGYQQPQQPGFQQPQQQFNNMFNQGGGTPMVQIGDALQRWIANLTNFKGRARRSEFWWVMLVVGIGCGILNSIFTSIGGKFGAFMIFIIWLAQCAGLLSITVRRLQDTNKPGILAWIFYGIMIFWALTILIAALSFNSFTLTLGAISTFLVILDGILGIVLLVFCVMDSQQGPNQHGPSEKYPM